VLVLELELLSGVYRAALPDGSEAEWPPHPERLFSALAQAWGDGGCDPVEQRALAWLEQQEPPAIEADPLDQVSFRDSPIFYVPPNDRAGVWIDRFPERRRQGRSFQVAVPTQAIVRFFWPRSPRSNERSALDRIARRLASVGHSASLAQARFRDDLPPEQDRLWRPDPNGPITLRVPHPDRLARLQGWLDNNERSRSGATQRYRSPSATKAEQPVKSSFGGPADWFVFEDDDGPFRPDILGFAHVAQRVRHALMQLGPQPASEVISGHVPSGGATTAPHLAVVPLQYVGGDFSDGHLLGFALVLPRGLAAGERAEALRAIAAFARIDLDEPRSIVQLTEANAWRVVRNANPARTSLRPERWCRHSRVWASTTPMLLDRFPSRDDPAEEAAIIAAACRNIGLPEPMEIEIHKHAAVRGAETCFPSRGHRSRPNWSFPRDAKFARRVRRHVVLRFAEAVTGPVVLGAGRFSGFGLCLPLDTATGR
jgi:CRISPR-associated protein Csb2